MSKTKSQLPKATKICATCGKPFTMRKKWRNNWDDVKYCSERCRNHRSAGTAADRGTSNRSKGA
jgi:hypothetical protein